MLMPMSHIIANEQTTLENRQRHHRQKESTLRQPKSIRDSQRNAAKLEDATMYSLLCGSQNP
jgi:hypothetical protein